MAKNQNLNPGDRLFASWTDNLQEVLSTYVSSNFLVDTANSTTVRITAGTGNNQVGIMINGKWRYITETVSLVISGITEGKDLYACAETENNYSGGGEDPDVTDYRFVLKVVTKNAAAPAGVAQSRKIATFEFEESGGIRNIEMLVNRHSYGSQFRPSGFFRDPGSTDAADIYWTPSGLSNGVFLPEVRSDVLSRTLVIENATRTSTSLGAMASLKIGEIKKGQMLELLFWGLVSGTVESNSAVTGAQMAFGIGAAGGTPLEGSIGTGFSLYTMNGNVAVGANVAKTVLSTTRTDGSQSFVIPAATASPEEGFKNYAPMPVRMIYPYETLKGLGKELEVGVYGACSGGGTIKISGGRLNYRLV